MAVLKHVLVRASKQKHLPTVVNMIMIGGRLFHLCMITFSVACPISPEPSLKHVVGAAAAVVLRRLVMSLSHPAICSFPSLSSRDRRLLSSCCQEPSQAYVRPCLLLMIARVLTSRERQDTTEMLEHKVSGVLHDVIHSARNARGSADWKTRPDGPASVSGHHTAFRCNVANNRRRPSYSGI